MKPDVVLLVDDQPIIGETVRAMLQGADDLELHVCTDPTRALALAAELSPSVILQDLVMPGVDGLMLVKFFARGARTKDIPLVVLSSTDDPATKADAFGAGAHDYIVKLPDPVELLARIRHHAAGHRALVERNGAFAELSAAREHLVSELHRAGRYARRLLPEPLSGAVRTRWLFEPCDDLGGDTFGYHFLEGGRFAFYVLDVVGHGVGAALHGVSIATVLRAQALPGTDFSRPEDVLSALNRAFPMQDHDGLYFTLFFGVFDPVTRRLAFASAGHPAPILRRADGALLELAAPGAMIGIDPDAVFEPRELTLDPGARVHAFTDGAYEIELEDGSMWDAASFERELLSLADDLPRFHERVRALRGGRGLDDDCTVLVVDFAGAPP